MLGTIVNTLAIIACSILGLFIKRAEKFEKPIINALALGVVFMGTSGVIKGLAETSTFLFMIYLVIGTIIGELMNIDDKFNRFGAYLGSKAGSGGNFSKGFITSTLIFCVGAMSIIGAFEDSLSGNHSILFTKAVMDGVTSLILSSMYGIGVMFSGLAVFIYQGAFAMLAKFLTPLFTDASIRELSTVGSVLVVAIGFDMLGVVKVKYANMLPAMFLPIVFYLPIVQSIINTIFGAFSL